MLVKINTLLNFKRKYFYLSIAFLHYEKRESNNSKQSKFDKYIGK